MAIDPAAGLVVNWPRTEPVTAWWMETSEEAQRQEIKEDLEAVEKVFDDAIAYIKAKDANPELATDLRYEAMRPALQGDKPLFVSAALAGQIESAVAWANRRGLKIVIVGGSQADRVSSLLKRHDVPVIVSGIHRLPTRRHDGYDEPFALPAKLHEAGVRFCIATGGEPSNERNLNHQAATAAAFGLPKEKALQAVTQDAASILGLGDTLGTLETGKQATLILTTGDPLEITTDTLVAYIDGRRIDLGSRHKSLYEKYQEKYRQLGLVNENKVTTR
jgi:imidazolonepropionase-like amidohydrolase